MTLQQVSAKKGKSVAENLIILAMIGLLMATFIYYFFKQEAYLSRVGFDSVANSFSARVTGIHAQWFMDNKPRWVIIKETTTVNGDSESNRIEVNKAGWIDVTLVKGLSNQNECHKIWQQVLATPMVHMRQPISAVSVNINIKIKINTATQQKNRLCQYSLPSGEYFEYQPSNGKVSRIKVRE
jgi:hypothetical protein